MCVQCPSSGSSSALPGPSLEAAVKLWSLRVSRQSVSLTRSGFFLPLALPYVSNCILLFWKNTFVSLLLFQWMWLSHFIEFIAQLHTINHECIVSSERFSAISGITKHREKEWLKDKPKLLSEITSKNCCGLIMLYFDAFFRLRKDLFSTAWLRFWISLRWAAFLMLCLDLGFFFFWWC